MPSDRQDHARDEFLAEAQELIEALSRDLLLLDQGQRGGEASPELLNELFRAVHTLKGLSGMFGFQTLARFAHVLEDLLEHLRMGRAELSPAALDLLFQGVEAFQRLLADTSGSEEVAGVDPAGFAERVRAITLKAAVVRDVLEDYELDPAMLAVLTEYEEHRLRAHLERGHTVYRLQIHVGLDAMEATLQALKQRIAANAEVISLLPSEGAETADTIALELILATASPEADLRTALGDASSGLVAVGRREGLLLPAASARNPVQPGESLSAPATRVDADVRARPGQLSLRSLTSVVRVEIKKLDYLMNAVGELGTLRSALARLLDKLRGGAARGELVLELQRAQRGFDRRLGEVQSAVLEVRMVPLSQLFDKLAVVVRQLAREQDKRVQLVVRGAETEIDKLIAEEIADPLVHLVRNAVDHGVESRPERAARGRPELASVTIHAYQKGNQVVIEVKDDGRGIDPALVAQAAIERGILSARQAGEMTSHELLDLIFLPGFSTRPQVSDISGRGVGMDVVKTNARRLGGAVQVHSEPGSGTTFTITLPITLAIIGALVFSVRGRIMSLPLAAVQEVLRVDSSALRRIDGREVLDLRGTTLPFCRLGELLCLSQDELSVREHYVIVLMVGNRRLGLAVERIFGQEDIVIKPLGPSLRSVRGIAGATDLGDQKLVLVLDPSVLLDEVLAGKSLRLQQAGGQA
jgi:two-component system chemotaxis sensor kinase CheA